MAAVTMGKPDKDVLERGFKRHRMRETKPLDDSVEHEGVAEVLGEHEFASAALEDTANLEETENDVMMRKEVKEVFPSVLRLARSFNAGVMIAVRVPAQLLVTFITLVIIPSVYNVQVVCTLFCFWGIHAAKNLMEFVRPMTGTSQGLKALYTYVESETDLFRERFTFFFPKTPTTLNHKNRTFYASKTVKTAECAEALKHLHARMAKPNQTEPITGATKEEMDTILNARALLREKQNNFTAYE